VEIWKQLQDGSVRLDFTARDKTEVIGVLVEALLEEGSVDPELPVVEEVLRREQVLSTGVGHGVALPHARMEGMTGTALAFGRPSQPVDVGAVDGKPADIFFLLIGDRKDPSSIVRTLGRLARLCDDIRIREGLRAASVPSEVIDLFRVHESAPEARDASS